MVPELLGLGVLGYSDPLGLGVPDCLLLIYILMEGPINFSIFLFGVSFGLYWFVLSVIFVYIGLYWFVLVCIGLYWFILVYIGLHRFISVNICLYWFVFGVQSSMLDA